MKNLLVRSDGNSRIGTGHLMRCLALAQAWQNRYGKVFLLTTPGAEGVEKRFWAEKIEILHQTEPTGGFEDASNTSKIAKDIDASWIVADGYHFTSDFQKILKQGGHRLLFVDDYGHADFYHADLVLNQNIYAHKGWYANRAPGTGLLLGNRYLLLRKEFLKWQDWKRETSPAGKKILITFGGSDPEKLTQKVMQALGKIRIQGVEVIVLIGGENPCFSELQSIASQLPINIRVKKNVADIPRFMIWADAAISASGTTAWEMAYLGLPNVLVAFADNQEPVGETLDRLGAAKYIGRVDNQDAAVEIVRQAEILLGSQTGRSEMTLNGRELFDGRGSQRIFMEMLKKEINLRSVREEDCRMIWEWSNDSDVRNVSFSKDPIPWKQHLEWFKTKLQDPDCRFFIAEDPNGQAFGQIRFAVNGKNALISTSIASKYRGHHYGSSMISLAAEKVFQTHDICELHAQVKMKNMISFRAFEKAGFQPGRITETQGHKAFCLTLTKQN